MLYGARLKSLAELDRASEVRWYGHVLRRGNDCVVRRALDCEAVGNTERGRPKMT